MKLLRCGWNILKLVFRIDQRRNHRLFRYDELRFYAHSGAWQTKSRETQRSQIIVLYHVLEKGLTMPNRHLGFGRAVVLELIGRIREYHSQFTELDGQVVHAIAVVKTYVLLHDEEGFEFQDDGGFAEVVHGFVREYPTVQAVAEISTTRSRFYQFKDRPFPEFAASRHTVRHYDPNKSVSMKKIRRAVEIAQTAPSACNRQHVRVYCLQDKCVCGEILKLQGGNRGFGHLADKVLMVVSDLRNVVSARERNDAYVNGGIFLMNLCYGLFHEEVAHCILSWAQMPEADLKLRQLVPVKESEVVIALLACGEAPENFSVALSPRKQLSEALVEV